jgi:hypothetical protein
MGRRSDNIEDRRGQSARGGFGFLRGRQVPGGLGLPRGRLPIGRRGGFGGIGLVIVVVAALLLGVDPRLLLQESGTVSSGYDVPSPRLGTGEDELKEFVSVVLADTEDTWQEVFAEGGRRYPPPTLVLFSDAVGSACGFAEAAMGPFYCPADGKAYIDLRFYDDLRSRFGAPGDFAQAYVIAHEVGHHVQNLLGISAEVRAARQRVGTSEGNRLSVMLELQADCFAGVWGHRAERARGILEAGDVEEGLNAASAIGDDRLQRRAGSRVVPDSFTHGSSAERQRWFRRGLESGSVEACDTFSAPNL